MILVLLYSVLHYGAGMPWFYCILLLLMLLLLTIVPTVAVIYASLPCGLAVWCSPVSEVWS